MSFKYKWRLSEGYPAQGIEKHNKKAFSCFACGGGSTMGYKLGGFDVIGCNEIDPKMMEVYKENHSPKYSFLEGIQTFKNRNDLPKELYNLDILDGSPPCSSFSLAGSRSKDWGKEKKFREGQSKQILDRLFFDFIDLGKKLQPKVIVAENVKGLILGKAKKYLFEIMRAFDNSGYIPQWFLLNGERMGIPQRRERVFFIALRKDLATPFLYQKDLFNRVPFIELNFNEEEIPFKFIQENIPTSNRKELSEALKYRWGKANIYGMYDERKNGGCKFGYFHKLVKWRVPATVTSGGSYAIEDSPHYVSENELKLISSFPMDYNFLDNKVQYIVGMSVPPVMMAQIANQIYLQWLSKINT
jgi:DNA (cytosine-5)-methyltransferase 1